MLQTQEVCKTATVDVAGKRLHSDDVDDDRDTAPDISRDTVYPLILISTHVNSTVLVSVNFPEFTMFS